MTVLVTFLTVVMLEGVAEIWPLSAGAKLKRRDRVLSKGEKNSFIALLGKGGSCFKDCSPPPLERITRSFVVKKEKNRFSDRSQPWERPAFFLLWGNLSHQS